MICRRATYFADSEMIDYYQKTCNWIASLQKLILWFTLGYMTYKDIKIILWSTISVLNYNTVEIFNYKKKHNQQKSKCVKH